MKLSVLVADDDPVSRRLIDRTITSIGYHVVTARDGLEARRFFREQIFEIVVADWEMPGLNGLELCRQIRRGGLPSYTYILILTSSEARSRMIEGLEAGADDYCTKPVCRRELQVRLLGAERVLRFQDQLQEANQGLARSNMRLQRVSRRDCLTGIGNRRAFEEALEERHKCAASSQKPYGVILCDVDHFKRFNDRFGHQNGDSVLQCVAQAIQASLRSGDHAYRYGGEEVAVLLPNGSLHGARVAAERIRNKVSELELLIDEQPVRVTISCGVSSYRTSPPVTAKWRDIVEQADRALYQAKRSGRNRVAIAESPAAPETAKRGQR